MDKKLDKTTVLTLFQRYGLILLVIIMCIILSIMKPTFLTSRNLLNILKQVSVNGIIAVGMTFILIAGQIDISVGSLVAASGVIAGSVIAGSENVFLALIAAVAVCSAMGYVSGVMVAQFAVPPMIATLAMQTIARGFSLLYTGGATYQVAFSKKFSVIGKGDIGGFPVPVLIAILVVIAFAILLNKTKFGRKVFAVGGNYKAATASGINCKRTLRMVFAISGALSGLAGVVLASRVGAGQPSIGIGYEMDAIAACVIGGTSTLGGSGSIFGTVVGVIIIGLISNALTLLNVNVYAQDIVKGVVIASAVIFDMASKKNSR